MRATNIMALLCGVGLVWTGQVYGVGTSGIYTPGMDPMNTQTKNLGHERTGDYDTVQHMLNRDACISHHMHMEMKNSASFASKYPKADAAQLSSTLQMFDRDFMALKGTLQPGQMSMSQVEVMKKNDAFKNAHHALQRDMEDLDRMGEAPFRDAYRKCLKEVGHPSGSHPTTTRVMPH